MSATGPGIGWPEVRQLEHVGDRLEKAVIQVSHTVTRPSSAWRVRLRNRGGGYQASSQISDSAHSS